MKTRRSTKRFARKNPSTQLAQIAERYTALHEGLPPSRTKKQTLPPDPKWLIELGPVPEFMYLKKTPDGEHYYRHKFANWARPVLARDDRGKLHIVDQEKLDVTDAGIEDKITMKSRRSIVRMNPSHAGHRYLSVRHNPFNMTAVKKAAIASGAVGLGVAATTYGLIQLFQRVQFLNGLTGYKSALAKAGIGIGGSLLVQGLAGAQAGKTNVADIVAASLGIGGVSAGALQALATYQASATPAPVPAPAPAPAQGFRRVG